MFEQDYIMRQIREFIAVIMEVMFGEKLESADDILEYQKKYGGGDDDSYLFRMIDSGEIIKAEELLYESIRTKSAANLLKGFAFYQYLAQQDDDFLEDHGFSRFQIAEGFKRFAALFDAAHLTALFLPE